MKRSPKLFIISLGCPKNLTDTQEMMGIAAQAGYELSPAEDGADAVLLNTCGFIASAVKESEDEIRRLIKLKRAGKIKKIVVAGCLAQRAGKQLSAKFPLVDSFMGVGAVSDITTALKKGGTYLPAVPLRLEPPATQVLATAPHTAYLKIADGCNNRCAYCTIPQIRGPYRSKPIEAVLAEARSLAHCGVKEISLVAQDTTAYGNDLYGKPALCTLLKKLARIPGIKWLRLMYVYPEAVSEELLKTIKSTPKICRYLDMPLQHVSDDILKRMNRRSTEAVVRAKIRLIRKIVPGLAVRTNFIAGFPGETRGDFEKLENFILQAGFYSAGFFAYSREKGTPAAVMPGQIAERTKQSRVETLVSAQSRAVDKFNRGLVGKMVTVLMDTPSTGRLQYDAPDIDGRVEVASKKPLKAGQLVKAKIVSAQGYVRQAKAL